MCASTLEAEREGDIHETLSAGGGGGAVEPLGVGRGSGVAVGIDVGGCDLSADDDCAAGISDGSSQGGGVLGRAVTMAQRNRLIRKSILSSFVPHEYLTGAGAQARRAATAATISPIAGPSPCPFCTHARSMSPIRSNCSATQTKAPTSPARWVTHQPQIGRAQNGLARERALPAGKRCGIGGHSLPAQGNPSCRNYAFRFAKVPLGCILALEKNQ